MSNGNAIIVAATILGLSLIGGSYLMVRSIDGAAAELGSLGRAISDLEIAAAAPAAPSRPEPTRRRGPDPEKVYTVETAGSPAKGPEGAKIAVVLDDPLRQKKARHQVPIASRGPHDHRQIGVIDDDLQRLLDRHLVGHLDAIGEALECDGCGGHVGHGGATISISGRGREVDFARGSSSLRP